ncbi:NTP transferase domain-containing protein [Novosphingobium flavum]|uniref:NTP transferase domain-containing protein n=1 Tax=Novosphingobium aerophilum TaxID=2839843 RepID=A0A7X1F911_9SPHN|nr:NTP transferase domain-containing protein [Novosphingobium aerophilum]MBC2652601.1 NTP transferase domain-containing protein [Novosphingobium aerophilum]MBC2662408.1 NTP transferase domain-containing protein [Novosphingobium aerophilum]
MDAVIIAAGYGSRLRDLSDSKPLTPVCGVPLIELGVRQAHAAGARRVTVVTGHEAARVESFLADLAQRSGIPILAERVSDWSRPNGFSVIAGAARVAQAGGRDFLLMMADHIFSAEILHRLAREGGSDRGVTLAIDRRVDNPLVDPDDATWVRTDEQGRIRAIGKTISPYDAVDCGAFLCTPELPEAIAEAIAAGAAGSLSDGMQRLADKGRAATMEIAGAWWLDVDDPRAHALAEAQAPGQLAALYG